MCKVREFWKKRQKVYALFFIFKSINRLIHQNTFKYVQTHSTISMRTVKKVWCVFIHIVSCYVFLKWAMYDRHFHLTANIGVKMAVDNIYTRFLFKSINRQVHQFKKSGACWKAYINEKKKQNKKRSYLVIYSNGTEKRTVLVYILY